MITWKPEVDGDDLIFSGLASWFGGPNDPGDDGQTASGTDNTKMGVRGCALPIPLPRVKSTQGSPLPRIPWQTPVEIDNGSTKETVPLIDVGPALDVGDDRPIDLTPQTFLDMGHPLSDGLVPVHIRVIGGAKYLTT